MNFQIQNQTFRIFFNFIIYNHDLFDLKKQNFFIFLIFELCSKKNENKYTVHKQCSPLLSVRFFIDLVECFIFIIVIIKIIIWY